MDATSGLIHPVMDSKKLHPRHGGEEHVILRFALDRLCDTNLKRMDRVARLRVMRDLLVHHTERRECITLTLLESHLGEHASSDLARRFAASVRPTRREVAAAAARSRREEHSNRDGKTPVAQCRRNGR
jgi:hypothetical protein